MTLLFVSQNEISNRFRTHENLNNIQNAYWAFKNNASLTPYLNDFLQLEDNSKGHNGKSLVFYYKSKTNCLNMFKKIRPLFFETKEREYKLEENPKPARVCHTNYEFGDLNFVKIYH